MANGVNKVILIGNLGKDPEIIRLESGVKKAVFSLATTEVYRNKEGEKVSHTEWHNIILWRGLAEVAENFLKKVNTVFVEGRIRKREYEDKDGVKRYITDILGDNMTMLSTRRDGGSNQEYKPSAAPQQSVSQEEFKPSTDSGTDDLPF